MVEKQYEKEHTPRYIDILSIQERMTQVAERLSSLVVVVGKLTDVAQEGATAQKDTLKLSEETKKQVGDELSALTLEVNQMNVGIDSLLKGDEEIQELRDILKYKLVAGIEKIIQMQYSFAEPIRKDAKIPTLFTLHEILKLSRRSNGCDETTGEKLTGFRFIETKIVYGLWAAIVSGIGLFLLSWFLKNILIKS